MLPGDTDSPAAQGTSTDPPAPPTIAEALSLGDWRRAVAETYARVRSAADPEAGWRLWIAERERLIRGHPQSPVPARRRHGPAPAHWPYDARLRILATLTPASAAAVHVVDVPGSVAPMPAHHLADAHLTLEGRTHVLAVHWLPGYAAGLLLAFRDRTSGAESYGGGRYLLDTAKGADLGTVDGRLVVDLNFAYQPSCAYDPRWSCPLPPAANRLDVAVRAGERFVPV